MDNKFKGDSKYKWRYTWTADIKEISSNEKLTAKTM